MTLLVLGPILALTRLSKHQNIRSKCFTISAGRAHNVYLGPFGLQGSFVLLTGEICWLLIA